ncbi:MAG: hypothetical protein OXE52_20805 [Chloroflexi bacterium]|nr:hypothetical protein [Chloroflexota bacterium]
MYLRRAISYPYRNMPKIITMVIILGIALLAFASMIERGGEMRASWPYDHRDGRTLVDLGLAGLILVFPVFMAWLMGYGLEVIRYAGEDSKSLPPVHFFWNSAMGLVFWFSRLIWGGLGMLIIGLLQGMAPLAARHWPVWDLALMAFVLVFTLESVAAAARCAALRRASAAFLFPTNLAFLFENKSAFAGLIGRLVLLNTAYVIVNGAFLQTLPWMERSLGIDVHWFFIAVICVGVFVFLLQTVSSLHLIGQFASRAASVGGPPILGELRQKFASSVEQRLVQFERLLNNLAQCKIL